MTASYVKEEVLLSVSGVELTLGGNHILRNVSANVHNIVRPGLTQGQVVALLGPSGVGKTQLFRILAGLNKPDAGSVLVGTGQKPVEVGQMGVVFQNYRLLDHRTVFNNLTLAARQGGASSSDAKSKSEQMLEKFGLSERGGLYPAQLSGGQRQRVAIAQQLLCSNNFLLMDEPFSGLDPLMVETVCRLVTDVAQLDELQTIIVVTHDIAAAVMVADTLWMMGRERDAQGAIVPGAFIKEEIDLIERGLAWHQDIALLPEFSSTMREVRAKFREL